MIDKAKLAEWRAKIDEGMFEDEWADLGEEAIPALLDEVERLRGALEGIREDYCDEPYAKCWCDEKAREALEGEE